MEKERIGGEDPSSELYGLIEKVWCYLEVTFDDLATCPP